MKYYVCYTNRLADADDADNNTNTAEIDKICTTLDEALDLQFEQIKCLLHDDNPMLCNQDVRDRMTLCWHSNVREMVTNVKGHKWVFYIQRVEANL